MPVARLIDIVSAAKFSRGLTAENTVYLGFFETTKGQLNLMYHAHGTDL